MYFDSFADLVAMGTHGPYVWSCYGLTALVILLNFIAVARQRRKAVETIRQKLRRQQYQEENPS